MNTATRVFIGTLVCCSTITAALVFCHRHSPTAADKNRGKVFMSSDNSQDLKFTAGIIFDGEREDGGRFSVQVFDSSDGMRLTLRRDFFKSPAQANEKLQGDVKKAVEITERGPKVDESGKQIGERAVMIFVPNPKNENERHATVSWTENSTYYSIQSSSLRHVLEFEKRFHY